MVIKSSGRQHPLVYMSGVCEPCPEFEPARETGNFSSAAGHFMEFPGSFRLTCPTSSKRAKIVLDFHYSIV
jgi:hypothetical protein